MAVIDPVALNHLPRLLMDASDKLWWGMNSAEGIGDYAEWEELIDRLRKYAILIESVAQDG